MMLGGNMSGDRERKEETGMNTDVARMADNQGCNVQQRPEEPTLSLGAFGILLVMVIGPLSIHHLMRVHPCTNNPCAPMTWISISLPN